MLGEISNDKTLLWVRHGYFLKQHIATVTIQLFQAPATTTWATTQLCYRPICFILGIVVVLVFKPPEFLLVEFFKSLV